MKYLLDYCAPSAKSLECLFVPQWYNALLNNEITHSQCLFTPRRGRHIVLVKPSASGSILDTKYIFTVLLKKWTYCGVMLLCTCVISTKLWVLQKNILVLRATTLIPGPMWESRSYLVPVKACVVLLNFNKDSSPSRHAMHFRSKPVF